MDAVGLKHILPLLIPIIALLIPIVAIVMGMVGKMRREQLAHETLRRYLEKGLPVPPELINGRGLASADDSGMSRRGSPLRDGAMSIAAGIGLAAMFYVMRPEGWLWSIGLVPLFVGVAMVVVWRIERAQPKAP